MNDQEIFYECMRCGEVITPGADLVELANGTMCTRCAKIRTFDAENPILYPKEN